MTKILVLEPHPLLRLGILQLLSDITPDCVLRGTDFSDLTRSDSNMPEFDLVLLSVNSAEDAQRLVPQVRKMCVPKAVLLVSDTIDLQHASQPLPTVVAGYLPKHTTPEVLQASVRLVLAGGTCFPQPQASSERPQGFMASLPSAHAVGSGDLPPSSVKPRRAGNAHPESEMLGLTPRQYEVLVLLARGYPIKTVGRYLNISVATAKAHTETLYQRLDVHNRNAAVYAAVSRGATLGLPTIQGDGRASA